MSGAKASAALLTEEEICRLVDLVREASCEPSFNELRAYLAPYISLFSRRYRIPGFTRDEIENECLCALRYKAIKDFDPTRGRFKWFTVLCLRRHLYSLIKSSNQKKRKAQNESLSLDEDRSIDGENLSLANVIAGDSYPVFDQVADAEARAIFEERLLAKLSPLEGEVWLLYLKRYHYGEIVEELQDQFTDQQITTKTVDNALQRVRAKIRELHGPADLLLQLRSGG